MIAVLWKTFKGILLILSLIPFIILGGLYEFGSIGFLYGQSFIRKRSTKFVSQYTSKSV